MDFTYFFAGFIGLVVGLLAAIIFAARKGVSKRRLIFIATAIAVALDGALLISWPHITASDAAVLLFDLLFFILYSVVGCTLGALPVLLARYVWRRRQISN